MDCEDLEEPELPPINVLIADDDDDDVRLIRIALMRNEGCPVRLQRVADGTEVLSLLKQEPPFEDNEPPDLLLLDLNMPIVDGWEVLEQIKRHPGQKDLPVVILSTSNNNSDVRQAFRLGASGFITKPDSLDELRRSLANLDQFANREDARTVRTAE